MVDLSDIAQKMVAPGKGLLAIDETVPHANAWLESHGMKGNEAMRRAYRNFFFTTPGAEQYLSGAILFTGTAEERADDGTPFPTLLAGKGILPGVKVDEGTDPLVDGSKEVITKGLIGLPERLAAYRAQGMQFTKWRAVIRIEGDKLPTAHALVENAKRLAAYALEVQKAGMVPMLEPEVLLEGKHSRHRTKTVITQILKTLFAALEDQAVDFTGVIVKTSMALTGSEGGKIDTPEEVAEDTLEALIKAVPKQVPGIVFLSGGQTPDQATANLAAICARAKSAGAPWPLTFSFARALQEEALEAWKGKEENADAARAVFLARLKKVSTALGA